MQFTIRLVCFLVVGLCASAVQAGQPADPADPAALAGVIFAEAGPKGGLCVHLGVTDGRLTAELSAGGAFVVHGLTADAAAADKARTHIRERGLYGRVSVDRSSLARLPYADNLVNLAVVDDLPGVLAAGLSLDEVVRVLAPQGVAWLGSAEAKALTADALKARLGGAGMKDARIVERSGVWARFAKPKPKEMDDWPSFDHGPDGNPVSQDTLVGPAASLRWRAGPSWGTHGASVVMGWVVADGRMFYRLRKNASDGILTRNVLIARDASNGLLLWERPIQYWDDTYGDRATLVADGRLYTRLEPRGKVVALDPATGQTLITYDQVPIPTYVLYHDGTLYMSVWNQGWAVKASDGKVLWQWKGGGPMVWADGQLYCVAYPNMLTCLDPATGQARWQKSIEKPWNRYNNPFYYRGALIVVKGAGNETNKYALRCDAYSPKTGELLWSFEPKNIARKGGCYMGEVFGAQGRIWVHADVEADREKNNAGSRPLAWFGLDPTTGQVKQRYDDNTSDASMMLTLANGLHRCNKGTATERFCLFGTYEFFEWATGKYHLFSVTRSACGTDAGMLPANGLVYTPPFCCTCREFMQRGFLAFACRPGGVKEETGVRLERGPAFASVGPADANGDDWPCYRRDATRRAATEGALAADLAPVWEQDVGREPTAPTVAGGRAFVASTGEHRVTALDAASGKVLWSFTAGGPIDSPPTIEAGRCLFGCRDGWVYCLGAADGRLAWRFGAAPASELICVDGRLESAWPVHGSVVMAGGLACFAAGWHTDLDGGVRLFGVKPESGEVVWSKVLEHLPGDPRRSNVPVSLLTSDGRSIFMGRWQFDAKTGERTAGAPAVPVMRFGGSGFLDNNWTEFCNTKGRLEWFDGRGSGELLASTARITCGVRAVRPGDAQAPRTGMGDFKLFGQSGRNQVEWSVSIPLQVRAIAIAGQTVFVAGRPDPEIPALREVKDPKQLAALAAELPGDTLNPKGGELWAFSAGEGKKLASVKVDAPPAFDALAIGSGRLYLSTEEGKLRCFAPK